MTTSAVTLIGTSPTAMFEPAWARMAACRYEDAILGLEMIPDEFDEGVHARIIIEPIRA